MFSVSIMRFTDFKRLNSIDQAERCNIRQSPDPDIVLYYRLSTDLAQVEPLDVAASPAAFRDL